MATEPAFTPEQMDAIARSRGYRDYAHMIYVARNGLPRPKEDNGTFKPQGSGGNFLQRLWNNPGDTLKDAFAWHPKNTIQGASDALRRARER